MIKIDTLLHIMKHCNNDGVVYFEEVFDNLIAAHCPENFGFVNSVSSCDTWVSDFKKCEKCWYKALLKTLEMRG